MSDWGIRARVLVLALAPSVMILLTLVSYFTYERIAEVDASLAQRGILVARQLAPGAEFALFAADRAALQRLTDAAIRETDVRSVSIADGRGQEMAHSGPIEPAVAEDAFRFTQPVVQTHLAVPDFPEQMHGSDTASRIGEITVEMSRSTARAQQRRLLLSGFGLGLAGLLVAIALAVIIGNGVIRPIRRLARAMVELGTSHHVEALPPEGGGELRTLTEGFNRMATRLEAGTRELEARINDATHALTVQKDAAEQATNAKSRFIAAASHDLRQPLHAIGLFSAALQRRAVGTELQPVAADLARAVSVMDRLFDSLLDISKLDAGSLHVEPRPFAVSHVFAQLAAEYSDAAEQKRLRFRLSPTSAVVISDELLLHRILSNLVANAIRYTSVGAVMVCCRRRNGDVQIEVRDSGMGIPADQQSAIFEEFYQIGNAARNRNMGLGLGLAIVARLAQLLGTEVQVRSAPGRGSVFALRLQRGQHDMIHASSEIKPALPAQNASLLPVLVIDDDPLVLAGNRALLEELGCVVTTVTDSHGAQEALAGIAGAPLLVLCDLWLSENENGISLLRRLSALATGPIYCILISGDTAPETIQAAREAGYPLLHKPVSPAKLRAVVMQFARKMRANYDPGAG